jgi:hypothetical protein
VVIIVKECSKCKEHKILESFYNAKNKLFNKTSYCKTCNYLSEIEYKKKNKDKVYQRRKKYRSNNKDKMNKDCITYRKNNKNRINENKRIRRKIDPQFKIKANLRNRLYMTVKNEYKSASTLELLGCTVTYLIKHLEQRFTEGMTWDNYGLYGWHIDHILPCASFDLTDPEQQKKCFHYSNLQPLWAADNISKKDKIL